MQSDLDAMLRGGQAELVLQVAEASFTGGQPGERAKVAVTACTAAGALCLWHKAVFWADRGLADDEAGLETQTVLWLLSGTARMYTGDLRRAEQDLNQFCQTAETLSSLAKWAGDAYFNHGHLMRLMKRPEDEVASFRKAAVIYEASGRTSRVSTCRYEIAWSLLTHHQVAEAWQVLQVALTGQEKDEQLDIDIQTALALYYHLTGRLDMSDEVANLLRQRQEMPPRQSADVLWVMGCNALARKDWSRAGQFAEEAMEAALEDWWSPQLERIQALRNQLARGKVGR